MWEEIGGVSVGRSTWLGVEWSGLRLRAMMAMMLE